MGFLIRVVLRNTQSQSLYSYKSSHFGLKLDKDFTSKLFPFSCLKMAMQTVRESLLSGPQIPWWNAFGSQPLAPVSLAGDSESLGETEHGVDKQSNSAFQLPFSLGGVKSSIDVPKPHGAAFSVQPPPCLELGFSQPQIYTKYPSVEQEYYGGVVSAYGSQSRVMLPLNMETEDGTIYVNSKQYHGIIRRRQPVQKLLLFFITTNLVSEVVSHICIIHATSMHCVVLEDPVGDS
ncbi:unnamed protein product [Brassica rapa subsp. trilocularis]